jgi:hypothetical protein
MRLFQVLELFIASMRAKQRLEPVWVRLASTLVSIEGGEDADLVFSAFTFTPERDCKIPGSTM